MTISGVASAQADLAPAPRRDLSVKEVAWGRAREQSALTMIARLDITSFPNSIGGRRIAGSRTLAQYGFSDVTGFDDGWAYAKPADGTWQFGVFVLQDGHRRKRLCVTDSAVGGGTYNGITAIDVQPGRDGLWRASKLVGAVPGCS